MSKRDTNRGCLGCMTVIALLVGCLAGAMYILAPTTIGLTARTYAIRKLESWGVREQEHVSEDEVGYLGQRLDDRQQKAYLQILEGVLAYSDHIAVLEASPEDVERAYAAMMGDHPELFWLDGSFVYTSPELLDTVTVEPGLGIDASKVSETRGAIEAAADVVLSTIPSDASEYDVAREVYRYIASSTDYDVDAEYSQTIQSVLLNHRSVCAGYARAYQYLLQRAGLFCSYVEGTIGSSGETHAWNLVRIDGEYVYVDPTWADPTYAGNDGDAPVPGDVVNYDYLCLTTDEILRDDHVFKDPDAWPTCEATDLDYYRRAGLWFDAYDDEALGEAFWRQANEGNGVAVFKFGTEEAYDAAMAALAEGNFQRENLLSLGTESEDGRTSIHYSYSNSDALRIVKLYW